MAPFPFFSVTCSVSSVFVSPCASTLGRLHPTDFPNIIKVSLANEQSGRYARSVKAQFRFRLPLPPPPRPLSALLSTASIINDSGRSKTVVLLGLVGSTNDVDQNATSVRLPATTATAEKPTERSEFVRFRRFVRPSFARTEHASDSSCGGGENILETTLHSLFSVFLSGS